MTVAEIVRKILPPDPNAAYLGYIHPGGTGRWTLDDYEKGWLVKQCITERKLMWQMPHIQPPVTDAYGKACSDYCIPPPTTPSLSGG